MTEQPEQENAAGAGSPAEDAPGAMGSGGAAEPAATFDAKFVNQVTNVLNQPTFSGGSTFGITDVPGKRGRHTGRLSTDKVADLLCGFVAPAGYDEAVGRLIEDHVVVLEGPQGIGKRTSALSLLREVTAETLFVLSPLTSLAELSERTYKRGCGYAVIDRHVRDNAAESEFTWHTVRERVAGQGAYLVVSCPASPMPQSVESVRHLSWSPPDLLSVVAARVSRRLTSEERDDLKVLFDAPCRVGDVVTLAEHIDKEDGWSVAISQFDATAHAAVSNWFDQQPSRRRVLEVTVLAFAVTVDERTFETLLSALADEVDKRMPDTAQTDEGESALAQHRRAFTQGHPIIKPVRVITDIVERNELHFAVPSYHRHVLAQLWLRMDVDFWNAVREWLDAIVSPELVMPIAAGLSRLAECAFDEVYEVLDPWAGGTRLRAGQETAIWSVWMMCFREGLGPASLRLAARWIAADPARRWTSVVAFSGELGAQFPHEAVNQLWRLAGTTDAGPAALAQLFATLVHTDYAAVLLNPLRERLDKYAMETVDLRERGVTLEVINAVLEVVDARTGLAAFLVHLRNHPSKGHVLACLWAAVLCNRPTRLAAITSLCRSLAHLSKHRSKSEIDIKAFGDALALALPEAERGGLLRDFERVARRAGRTGAPLIVDLLTALIRVSSGAKD